MSVELSPENSRYLSELVSRGALPLSRKLSTKALVLVKWHERLRADVQLGIDQANRGEAAAR